MPPDPKHPACQNCDRKCSALEAEAVAKSYPSSFFAAADVVSGSRNLPTADGRESDRLAACEPEPLLVVVVSAVVAAEDRISRVCGHSTEPSSLCRSFA